MIVSCKNRHGDKIIDYTPPANPLFTQLSGKETGIDFVNVVVDDSAMNIFNYRNFYNGGGVAIGDINNDGLADVFFTSNQHGNKLYLNKGNFKFEDITERAGIAGNQLWNTGVSMVDINADGLLDIYVCNSGGLKGDKRVNELFINKGNLTFRDSADSYNLKDEGGYHTHAAFFDYDMDGDLDCFLLNNSSFPVAQIRDWSQRNIRDSTGGDKLLRNDNGHFTDVSKQAGIYGSLIGFGLGVNVADVNGDMWPDIYVSNDFFEKDYLYINQHNGTFVEAIEDQIQHTSQSSMGADIADINNDGRPDIFTTDMLPESDHRLKTTTKFDDYDLFNTKLRGDLHRQYLHNCLQLNNGDNTFSEISELAGVNATDWSWGALIFDFDNDGWKDLFVSNGISKDLTNQDYIDFLADANVRSSASLSKKIDIKAYLEKLQSTPVANYGFVNQKGSLLFKNDSYKLGLAMPSFSNGAAYGDLDNDGDIDLVVNNENEPCFVYRNNSEALNKNNYLRIKLKGLGKNTYGYGAEITGFKNDQKFVLQQMPSRGFQSSVDPVMVMGLDTIKTLDSLKIVWPDLKQQTIKNVATHRTIELFQKDANEKFKAVVSKTVPLFTNITNEVLHGDIMHKENAYIDFDKERLLPKVLSTEGPKIAVGDLNNDGREDIFMCSASGDIAKLYFQNGAGQFQQNIQQVFSDEQNDEMTDVALADIDGDNDLDICVAIGGNEEAEGSPALRPKIFINDGHGNFYKGLNNLPAISLNASCIKAADFNNDGFIDLFVGARNIPGKYGIAPAHYLLQNDGHGRFTAVQQSIATALKDVGMVTDAQWVDIDNDGWKDLVLVGDWMAVTILKNNNGKLSSVNKIPDSEGWWNCLKITDVNNDGRLDIIAGNMGLNSKVKVDIEHPAKLYIEDFDKNGQVECMPVYYKSDNKAYPFNLRGDVVAQMPSLKKKFLTYESYASQPIENIFSNEQMQSAVIKEVKQQQSCIFLNDGKGGFIMQPMPVMAQVSSIFGFYVDDFNNDAQKDIFMAGNFFGLKPEMGRYDASYGLTFLADNKNNYKYIAPEKSGLFLKGEVRDIKEITTVNGKYILVARNNDALQAFKLNAKIVSNK